MNNNFKGKADYHLKNNMFSELVELLSAQNENVVVKWFDSKTFYNPKSNSKKKPDSIKSMSVFFKYIGQDGSSFLQTISAYEEFDKILSFYFSRLKHIEVFERLLAEEYSTDFIEAVKHNLIFLKDKDRLEVYKEWNLPVIDRSLNIWVGLYTKYDEYWNRFQSSVTSICSMRISFEDLFHHTIYWMEEFRFQKRKDNQDPLYEQQLLSELRFAYDMMVSVCFTQFSDFIKINHRSFIESFTEMLRQPNQELYGTIEEVMISFVDYQYFILNGVYEYSYGIGEQIFDDTINLIHDNRFCAETIENWKTDENRYHDIRGFFMDSAKKDITEGKCPEIQRVINSVNKESNEENLLLFILQVARQKIFDALEIPNLKVNNKDLNFNAMYNPLHSYAFNRSVRCEKPLDISDHNTWVDWYKSHMQNMLKQPELGFFPFIEETENSFQEGVDNVYAGKSPLISGDIFSMFSFKLKSGTGNCNRFVIPFYQFDDKPFINIGKLNLSPTMLFANMDFFYFPLNKALRSLSCPMNNELRKTSASKFEKRIVSAINELICDVKTKWDADTGNGNNHLRSDIDIIVEDNTSIILIQVKRTKFRLNLEEQYNEFINVDRKACRQINNAIKEFPQKFGFDIGDRKVYKWIVSNSFERSYQRINGCLKVPVFDIFRMAGRNTFVSVAEFAESVESHEE